MRTAKLLPLALLLSTLASAAADAPRTTTQDYTPAHYLAPYCGAVEDSVPDVETASACFDVLPGETAVGIHVRDAFPGPVPFTMHAYDADGRALADGIDACDAAAFELPTGSATIEVWPNAGPLTWACGPRDSTASAAISTWGTITATFT